MSFKVHTVVSLINSLCGAVRKLSNKRSSRPIPLLKKHDIVVSLNSENGSKVAKLAKDFDTPTTTLTTISKHMKTKKFMTFLIRV